MNVLRAYDRALQRHPIAVKVMTSGVLFGAGDALSQRLESRTGPKKPYDWARTGRMVGWGAMFGVLAHGWYTVVVERITVAGYPGIAAKVLADQLVWTPPLNMLFFTYSGVMDHGNVGKAVSDGKAKLWPLLKVNWGVWFPVQAINFTLMPVAYRVLFVNTIALFWSAYLSTMAASDAPGGDDVKHAAKAVTDAEATDRS